MRYLPALAKTNGRVLVIAGIDPVFKIATSTVFSYDIASNAWNDGHPLLIEARSRASACVLQGTVYVFCGESIYGVINSIEAISETSLFPNSAAKWLLIEVPENILAPRFYHAVAPINATEIAILGGYDHSNYFSDIIVFKTITKTCDKVVDGGD